MVRGRNGACGLWVGCAAVALGAGCVERTMKIQTDPPGATVIVNDEEVGVSPAKFAFTWYGDYDIVLRKPGYKTLKTHHELKPPWYQIPPIDFVSECLMPQMFRDHHDLPVYTLEPADEGLAADIVERAEEMRDRALFTPPR